MMVYFMAYAILLKEKILQKRGEDIETRISTARVIFMSYQGLY